MRTSVEIPCLLRNIRRVLPLLFPAALALAVAGARADTAVTLRLDGDSVGGTIATSGAVERIPFRAEEGASVTLTLSAAPLSQLHPRLVLLGTDRHEDAAAAAAMRTTGRTVSLRNYVLPATGLQYLEVRSADGSTGAFTLATKAKHGKSAAGGGTVAGGGTAEFRFIAPGGATAAFTVSAARRSAAHPEFVRLLDPAGGEVAAEDLRTTSKGFTLRGVPLDAPGSYTLVVGSPEEASGAFTAAVRWTVGKILPRNLDASKIAADPVLLSVSPDGGDISQAFSVRVTGDFVAPGASVLLRGLHTSVPVAAKDVQADAAGLSFPLDLASCADGIYDVVVKNADGGSGTLAGAFTVRNLRAVVDGASPASGREDESVRVSISGALLTSTADVALVRGDLRIPGTVVVGFGAQIGATFDLRGQPLGAWDLVVANAGTDATSLAGAFTILQQLPPAVVSISPDENTASPMVAATVVGSTFRQGASLRLTREGFADIVATSVTVVSSGLLQVVIDTTGAEPGPWDVVVTNQDGQTATLPGGFIVVAPVVE